ncbi:hypothetical protein FRC12_018824 [Ceratobasidium sp. 428]|nr:hypothetical protein FRC12_018824 [Ceratobasidium sp. 428]
MHSILPPHLATSHSLPDFRSLIVQGCYPPAAPIHLCLSHLSSELPTNKALLISSSKQYLSSELEEYNDAWLAQHAGDGTVAEHLHQIDIFYPPTYRHLRLLLARLRTYSTPNTDADSETDLKACLSRPPTLLILHELSRYFLSPQLAGDLDIQEIQLPTLSTYMQFVIDAIAALQFLSSSDKSLAPPRLVIFDKELHTLALPIVRPVNLADINKLPKQHKANVTDVLQRYIGWVATVEKVENEEIPSSQTDEIEIDTEEVDNEGAPDRAHFRMTLQKSPSATVKPIIEEQTFEWYSYRDPYEPPFTPRRQTIVVPL